jgi:hypothetical protein
MCIQDDWGAGFHKPDLPTMGPKQWQNRNATGSRRCYRIWNLLRIFGTFSESGEKVNGYVNLFPVAIRPIYFGYIRKKLAY